MSPYTRISCILLGAALLVALYRVEASSNLPKQAHIMVVKTELKMKLLTIAKAEQHFFGENKRYASLQELVGAGEIPADNVKQKDFEFFADIWDTSFQISATYQGPPAKGMPSQLTVDESNVVQVQE